MKRMLICGLLLGGLLAGCGSKKRSLAQNVNTESPATKEASQGAYPMPEDPGRFVFVSANSPEHYIRMFSDVAKSEMRTYGIPASITLAQGLLESGFGKGELTRKTNNHFGIKCHTGWEGDYERHDDDERGECFRKYNHPMYSFRDHSLFLTTRSRYAALFDLDQDDYKAWARGLKAAGYATDRKYPQKLIQIIERYQLYRYDEEVLGRPGRGSLIASAAGEYEMHRVQAGDTLYGISRRYRMTVDELMRLNELDSNLISVGQLLKVKPENTRR